MLAEEGSCYHTHPVVHKTRGIQLAHAGIYQRVACLTCTPFLKFSLVIPPLNSVVRFPEILMYHMGKMKQDLHKEFTPDQFTQVSSVDRFQAGNYLPDAYCSKPQVWANVRS